MPEPNAGREGPPALSGQKGALPPPVGSLYGVGPSRRPPLEDAAPGAPLVHQDEHLLQAPTDEAPGHGGFAPPGDSWKRRAAPVGSSAQPRQ